MRRALEIELHRGVQRQLRVLVAVIGAEKPKGPSVIDLPDIHRPGSARFARRDGCAKETHLRFRDDLLDLLDRLHTAEVGARFFHLVLIDGVHVSLSAGRSGLAGRRDILCERDDFPAVGQWAVRSRLRGRSPLRRESKAMNTPPLISVPWIPHCGKRGRTAPGNGRGSMHTPPRMSRRQHCGSTRALRLRPMKCPCARGRALGPSPLCGDAIHAQRFDRSASPRITPRPDAFCERSVPRSAGRAHAGFRLSGAPFFAQRVRRCSAPLECPQGVAGNNNSVRSPCDNL